MKDVGLCFTCLFLVPLTVVHVDPRGVFFVSSHSIFFYHYNFLWPNDVTTLVLFKNTSVLGSQSKSANSPLHFQTCELFVHLIFANQPNWKSHTISICKTLLYLPETDTCCGHATHEKENWWCYTALIWTTMSDGKFHLLMWLFKARQENEFEKGPGRQTGRKRQLLISPVWCQLVPSKAWGKLRAITAWCVRVCVCCFQSMCSHSKSLFPFARNKLHTFLVDTELHQRCSLSLILFTIHFDRIWQHSQRLEGRGCWVWWSHLCCLKMMWFF